MLLHQIGYGKVVDINVNYIKELHNYGIRRNDDVLVVGGSNMALLVSMARLIGPYGSITVIDRDPVALADVFAMAEVGQFKAIKPFTQGHPAFDFRKAEQRFVTVPVHIQKLASSNLPYADDQFSDAWVEGTIPSFLAAEKAQLENELKRVAKRFGKPITEAKPKQVVPAGFDPSFYTLS